jgi:hypothetical protein
VPESELAFQEALIEERETEIREIESGIHELNEIFRDLGTIVHEQQSMLGPPSSRICSPFFSPFLELTSCFKITLRVT